MLMGKEGASRIRNRVLSGKVFPSHFLISWCTLPTDLSARVDRISSSDIPSKESVLTTPGEKFSDKILSTWKLGKNQGN
jgi:hypothetical protein